MCKLKFFLLILVMPLLYVSVSGQANALGPDGFAENYLHKGIDVFDASGKTFVNPYIDVLGTPFFIETWKYGKIEINGNKVFTNIQLRLNLQSQEVHFRKSDNIEMVVLAGMVKKITLLDTVENIPVPYTFQCGLPSIDNQKEKSFYQVLSDGKVKFLKSLNKSIYQDKDGLSGEVHKEFRTYENYYLYYGISIKRIKKDKEFILDILRDQKDKIEEYSKKNNLNYKSIEDLQKIIDYYNSLPPL